MEKHPESRGIDLAPQIKDETVVDLVKQVEKAVGDRSQWENKQRVFYERRFGIRGEKNFPWPGSSNINIPLIDKTIRRQKPLYVSAVFGVNPVLSIETLGEAAPERARRIENFYDWLIRYKMDHCRETQIHSIDHFLTYGQSYIKAVWDHQTERKTRTLDLSFLPEDVDRSEVTDEDFIQLAPQMGLDLNNKEDRIAFESVLKQFRDGKEFLKVSLQVVKQNAPAWHFVDSRDIVVPFDSSDEIDTLPWIAHRMFLTPAEIKARGIQGMYDSEVAQKVAKESKTSEIASRDTSYVNTARTVREGVSATSASGSHIEVYEIYFHHDINGDGLEEKCVMTISAKGNEVLRLIEYPYEHGEWPFTRFVYEITEPRWYAPRGIPELLHDLNAEINAQHNAKLDRMTIQNALTFKVREGSIRNPSQLRFRPGSYIPVRRMDDIQPITHQVMDYSFEAEERTLKAYAEEYVGVQDFGISNVNQKVERRTAAEVQEISRMSQMQGALDIQIFQESMRRLHRQTLFLWAQYGDMSVMVNIDGREPVMFNRWDLYSDFDLIPTGRLDNMDSRARSQKALADMQVASSPNFSPFINSYELVRDYFENSDYRSSRRFLRAPGVMEEDAASEQLTEIQFMQTMKQVAPVDQGDAHQIHMEVLQQAIEANMEDQELVLLMTGHLALHSSMLGDNSMLEQLQQQGAEVQQQGTRVYMSFPTPDPMAQGQVQGGPPQGGPPQEAPPQEEPQPEPEGEVMA